MKITAMMIVRNEADRYLMQVLDQLSKLVDDIAITDDHSTDNTLLVASRYNKVRTRSHPEQRFGEEWKLRTDAWNFAMEGKPDWILAIDADELFEESFDRQALEKLCNDSNVNLWGFHLHDMWSPTHYRDDQYWRSHHFASYFLIRPDALVFGASWSEKRHHCGRIPQQANVLVGHDSGYRIKHMGWARPDDRIAKYHRYKQFDPDGKYGWPEQYESILDENPATKEWAE